MKRLVLGFWALAASCYSPDLSGVHYICNAANPYCPDGHTCQNGLCLPAETSSGSDGGISPAPPDAAMVQAGCRSGMGYPVGTGFACPGPFNASSGDNIPRASELCAPNYQICTNATGIDQTACKLLSGFFAAQVPMDNSGGTNPNNFQCQPAGSSQARMFAGCGRQTPNDIYDLRMTCSGFNQALHCEQDQQWSCSGSNQLDSLSQTNGLDGVLCCKL